MKELLIHTSNVRVDILEPQKLQGYDRPCICFSLNQFVSYFGEYVYLFYRIVLEKDFYVEVLPSMGVKSSIRLHSDRVREYRYRSEDLGQEFRIYKPIDVKHYGIGVITNFNHLKGILEKRINHEVIHREQIDFTNKR